MKLKIAKKIEEKKTELKKLQELYSKPETIPAEVKTQVAKKIEVTIPAGVDTNNKIKLNPKGMREVVLNISVTPNIKFKRNKNHLYTDVAVAFDDLILGCEIEVEHLMGKIALVIPANSQNKQKFKLHEKGMPIYNGDGARGDVFVVVNAVIPDSMSEKQKQHIVNYRQLKSDN